MDSTSSSSVFGKRLREARQGVGMPQDKLGVKIGLDEGTASARISRYETGTHAAPFDIARKLAKVLRVPTAFLYCEDDELAAVILAWGRLPKGGKKRVAVFINDEAPALGQDG